MLRATIRLPHAGARPLIAALGCDQEASAIWPQGFGDQTLAHTGTVGVRCVYEGDAELDGSAQHRPRAGGIVWIAPDPATRQAHCAEAKATDNEVTADVECLVQLDPLTLDTIKNCLHTRVV